MLSQSEMVIYSLEIIQLKEITLVLSQPQGADLGTVRILLLWERGMTGTLSHLSVLIEPCVF